MALCEDYRQLLYCLKCGDFQAFPECGGDFMKGLCVNFPEIQENEHNPTQISSNGFAVLPNLLIETYRGMKTLTGLLFLYFPHQQLYLGFYLNQCSIHAFTSYPHSKYRFYREKEDKYAFLYSQASVCTYQEWKSRNHFIDYSMYWLWVKECQEKCWNSNDYDSYALFKKRCRYAYQNTCLTITYNEEETRFNYTKWLQCKDYATWKKFCKWKQDYYTRRCYYFQNKSKITCTQVARRNSKVHLQFIVDAGQVIWLVDNYIVYTHTPFSVLSRFHVGYSGNAKEAIKIYRLITPIDEPCLTTEPTSESTDCMTKPFIPMRCPPVGAPIISNNLKVTTHSLNSSKSCSCDPTSTCDCKSCDCTSLSQDNPSCVETGKTSFNTSELYCYAETSSIPTSSTGLSP